MEVIPAEDVEMDPEMTGGTEGTSVQAVGMDDSDGDDALDGGDQSPVFIATPGVVGTPTDEALKAGNAAASEAKRMSIAKLSNDGATEAAMRRRLSSQDIAARRGTAAAAADDDEFHPSGPRALESSIVQASLSKLGHTSSGQVVFTCATLSSLALKSVDALSAFVHLQKVQLDNNHLTTLAPLRALNSLITVSASHNELTASVFRDLSGCVKSLQELDVSFNRIDTLDGVCEYSFLQRLDVSDNALTALTESKQISGLRSLTRFNAANNTIANIEPRAFDGCRIRDLDVSQNAITDMAPFLLLSNCLLTLNAADNNIMHFETATKFKKLAEFNIAGNNAYDMQEVYALAQLPLLRKVSLLGNPLCNLSHGIDEPIEDDAASDIVRQDEGARRLPKGAKAAAAVVSQTVPGASSTLRGTSDLAKNAVSAIQRSPDEEDQDELTNKPVEERYRLCVLWRAPNITHLDGVEVTAQELTQASNLEGGQDRGQRSQARSQFLHSSGAPALSLRRSKKGVM